MLDLAHPQPQARGRNSAGGSPLATWNMLAVAVKDQQSGFDLYANSADFGARELWRNKVLVASSNRLKPETIATHY